VGPNAGREFGDPGGHAIDVSLESVNVENQGGGYELLPFAADGASVHGLDPLSRRVDDGSTTRSKSHRPELLFVSELAASDPAATAPIEAPAGSSGFLLRSSAGTQNESDTKSIGSY